MVNGHVRFWLVLKRTVTRSSLSFHRNKCYGIILAGEFREVDGLDTLPYSRRTCYGGRWVVVVGGGGRGGVGRCGWGLVGGGGGGGDGEGAGLRLVSSYSGFVV